MKEDLTLPEMHKAATEAFVDEDSSAKKREAARAMKQLIEEKILEFKEEIKNAKKT